MLDGSLRPICEWETSGMEEDSCCICHCGTEGGLHRQDTLIQVLHQREKRLTRMTQFLTAALLVVISVALALLIALLLRGTDPETLDSQPTTYNERHSSDINVRHQQHEMGNIYPSALLTAPHDSYTVNTYVEWQSELGNAHCQGGFNYSNGNLVVPRQGKYKVYLQITYENASKCDGHEIILSNKVFVYQEAYHRNIVLLSSVDTVSCTMKQWRKSLHTDSSFELGANSKLWVHSSHPDLIVKNEASTFFGAELQTVHVSI